MCTLQDPRGTKRRYSCTALEGRVLLSPPMLRIEPAAGCPQVAVLGVRTRPGSGSLVLARTLTGRGPVEREGRGVDAVRTLEHEVRELIRRSGLDPARDEVKVRRLVQDAVTDYDERSMHGGMPLLADLAAASKALWDTVAGYGPLQQYFDDPTVEEIWVNGRLSRGSSGLRVGGVFGDPAGHPALVLRGDGGLACVD